MFDISANRIYNSIYFNKQVKNCTYVKEVYYLVINKYIPLKIFKNSALNKKICGNKFKIILNDNSEAV